MPRIPGVDHQDAVRALQKAGFRIARQGKHIVMTDGVRIITIPRHNPVNAFTMGGNATRLFITRLGDRAVVSPQNPLVIQPRSEPQPDLLLLRPRAVSYSREYATPADVLLAVEVADATVRFDRLVKARLYARASIPEFWLFLTADASVEVYRAPGADGYASVTAHGSGQILSPLAFPAVGFAVTEFFA